MAIGSYDSPTFLGQKDKYMLGLSLPQLMGAVGVGFCWFLVTLLFPYSTPVRMAMMAPLTGVTLALLFVRIVGLTIPVFLILSFLRLFSKPSYEETREFLLDGRPEWLEAERLKMERGSRKRSRRQREPAPELGLGAKQAELRAEVDKQVTAGAVAAEQWVRDGVRVLMKGR